MTITNLTLEHFAETKIYTKLHCQLILFEKLITKLALKR